MKLKKIISLGIAAIMSTAVLSSCSNSDDDSSSSKADGVISSDDYYNAQAVDTGWEWSNAQIVGGGFVPNIIYNPTEEGLAYARTDIGGAYKLDNESGEWVCITDCIGGDDWNLMGIESIATDPVEPNRVYLAAGTYTNSDGAILVSDDYGENWVKVDVEFKMGGNEVGRGCGERLQVDPSDNSILYFGSRADGLYRSTDYGMSWELVESFPTKGGYTEEGYSIGITWVAFDKSSASDGEACQTLFAGAATTSGNVIFRSDDAGETWSEVENPTFAKTGANDGMRPIQGEISSDGYLYCTFGDKAGPNNVMRGSVQKYSIADGTWEEITPDLSYTCGYSGLSVNPNDPDMIVVTTLDLWAVVDNVFTSFDGGETWTGFWDPETTKTNYTIDISECEWLDWQGQLKLGWWMTGVAINPFNPDEIMYGTGATIFKTDNLLSCQTEEVNLSVAAMGIEETAIFDIVSPNANDEDAPEIYSILGDLYGFRHDDVNTAPTEHFGDFKSTSLDCAMLDYNIVVRATDEDNGTIYYSEDAGDTWEKVASLPQLESGNLIASGGQVKLSADGQTILWQPGLSGSSVYCTKDRGETWTECTDLPGSCTIETDKVNPDRFYAVRDGKFYMSEDGGESWSVVTEFLVSSLSFEACPDTEGDIWIALYNAGVYYLDADGDGELVKVSDNVQDCSCISLGKAADDSDYMTLYMLGEANNEGEGVYMSTDKGVTWTRINDDTEKWGNVNDVISGDPKTFGRVYISTNGRGIIMGNIKE
ncbi:MAG: cellulose-binding protein [Ruminococcus sp.]|nr:cellulose-binding protein [Ruminococcus sp.]